MILIQRPADVQCDRTKLVALKTLSCGFFKSSDLILKLKTSIQQTGRKNNCFSVGEFCLHCNTVFEAICCFYYICRCQEVRSFLTEKNSSAVLKNPDELRRKNTKQKRFAVSETRDHAWYRVYKRNSSGRKHIREKFLCKISLADY